MEKDSIRINLIEKTGINRTNEAHAGLTIPKGTEFKDLLEVMGLDNFGLSAAHWDIQANRYVAGKFFGAESGEVHPGSYWLDRDDRKEYLSDLVNRVTRHYNEKE
tara:strand:+ start:2055 stop:2369 length:315 start_codon:yes stop_codon:yes gene_type:complete